MHEVESAQVTVDEMHHRFLHVHDMDKVRRSPPPSPRAPSARWSSATPSGAPTASSAASRRKASTPPPSTATSASGVREQALKDFDDGKLHVLVATDVAARGIHVDDVDVVIHYDPPTDHKTYLHRSGRTARAGESGVVVTLVLWNQELEVKRLQKRIGWSTSPSSRSSPTIPASGTCWPGIPPRSWSLPDRPTRAWLTALRAWAGDGSVAARPLLAGLTRELFVREGLAGTQVELLDAEGIDGFPPMPDGAGADLLGLAHEALLAPADRKARGAHYTPPALADRLVALSLPPTAAAVLDPACGGGAFLLAAGRALVARGRSAGEAVRCLHGIDVDPLAVEVARAATALWSGGTPAKVTVGDFLVLAPEPPAVGGGSGATTDGFDAVIGNPPFASPLRVTTSRSGSSPGAYTDTAGLFLLRALDLLRPGGRVGLIQPQSVLTSRDADGVRAAVEERAALRALWVAEERVFAASTHVVAVIAEKGGAAGPVDSTADRPSSPAAGHRARGGRWRPGPGGCPRWTWGRGRRSARSPRRRPGSVTSSTGCSTTSPRTAPVCHSSPPA